ncbi:MAG: hypothetical protein HQ506_00225 [Candidatus Marinimicrobia bacterium]|nr:hypothetical protein [Candidatus Neomarinimicrobiota bacterium]
MRSINIDSLTVPDSLARTILIDALVLVSFYLTIVFAHLLPFPLYKLDPMKILVLITVVYSNRGNALGMAAALPILSFLSTGHPVFPKFMIMSLELIVFAFVFIALSQNKSSGLVTFLGAVLISKGVYYLIKAGAIALGFLDQVLISTDLYTQIQALVILGAVYFVIQIIRNRTQLA